MNVLLLTALLSTTMITVSYARDEEQEYETWAKTQKIQEDAKNEAAEEIKFEKQKVRHQKAAIELRQEKVKLAVKAVEKAAEEAEDQKRFEYVRGTAWAGSRDRFDYIQDLKARHPSLLVPEIIKQSATVAAVCPVTAAGAAISGVLDIIPLFSLASNAMAEITEPTYFNCADPIFKSRYAEETNYGLDMTGGGFAALGVLFPLSDSDRPNGKKAFKISMESTAAMGKAVYSKESWSQCNIARFKMKDAASIYYKTITQ